MNAKIIRFPSRVTGAMRLPDPLDYPNEGEIYRTGKVIVFPPRHRISPLEVGFSFALSIMAAFFLFWHQ